MARLSLTLLGGFRAQVGSAASPALSRKKAQAILAYLALPLGYPHTRDEIVALLWGDVPAEQGRQSLRQTVFELRRAFVAARLRPLRVDRDTIALRPEMVDVDVAVFEDMVKWGSPKALERATSLYRGELLAGFRTSEPPFEDWLRSERHRLREVALGTFGKLLTHHTEHGAFGPAIQTAVRLLALDPCQESVHRTLMQLYERQGRRNAALQQYQTCVEVLGRELGVEPDAQTRRLYQSLLPERHQPSRALPQVAGRRVKPPTTDTPLIGRAPELHRLQRAMEGAWAGAGQVVAILGEAGIGKTRMISALADVALRRGGQVLLGRCYESEQVFPLSVWVELLRAAIKDQESEDGHVWRADLSQLLPELRSSDAQPPGSPADQFRLFDAVVQFVRHLACRRSQMVVVEDLQWADDMSLRLLSFLGRRMHDAPVLIVGTARADEIDQAASLRRTLDEFDRDGKLLRLTLSPLSQQHTVDLVRALARSSGAATRLGARSAQIWEVSEGNPFIVVETVRALQEATEPPAVGHLPLSQRVRRLVSTRLERLGEQAQELLPVAAVIGRTFEFKLLHRASGLDEAEVAGGLEELVRRRVLHRADERFDFVHDRIREVAYGGLGILRRKLLHGQVARALEQIHSAEIEPYVEAIGTHYREAEAWDKAHLYLRSAGAKARARAAHGEAVEFFQQALAAVRRLPRTNETVAATIDLLVDLRPPLIFRAEHRRALGYLREAEMLARELGDQRRLGFVACHLSGCLRPLGANHEAIEASERALVIASTLGDLKLEVMTASGLGQAYGDLGEYRRAREFLTRAITTLSAESPSTQSGSRLWASTVLSVSRYWLATCLAALGEFPEAMAHGRASLDDTATTAQSDRLSVTLACLAAAAPLVTKGDAVDAIPLLECALLASRTGDLTTYIASSASRLGLAYVLAGRISEGLPLLEEGPKCLVSTGQISFYPLTLTHLAEGYSWAGRLDNALRVAREALEAARTWKHRGAEATALYLISDISSRLDSTDVGAADGHCRDALKLAKQLGMRPLAARCHLERGRLYAKLGRMDEARNAILTAIELFRTMQMAFWLHRAESALSRIDGVHG